MRHHPSPHLSPWPRLGLLVMLVLLVAITWLASACDGDSDGDSGNAVPLQITAQPADTAVVAGTAATLSVQAQGDNVGDQWPRSSNGGTSWVDIAGATSARWVSPEANLADDGTRQHAMVSAAGVAITSSAVRLSVTAAVLAPTIGVQPAAQTIRAPAAAVFSVTAGGTLPSYRWQRSADNGATWADIAGATSASHDSGPTILAQDGTQIRVIVANSANSANSVTSTAVRLTVSATAAAAAIATPPFNQSVTAGSTVIFTTVVSGTPMPLPQWQRSLDGGTTWADIVGATAASHATDNTVVGDDGQRFCVKASNSGGTATRSAAVLSVTAAPQAPAVTTQRAAQSVVAPTAAIFTVAASGAPQPAVQWQLSTDDGSTWTNIVGATVLGYTTPATVVADNAKRYRAQLSSISGNASSSAALLTVAAAPAGCGRPRTRCAVPTCARPAASRWPQARRGSSSLSGWTPILRLGSSLHRRRCEPAAIRPARAGRRRSP